jgi:lipopolysaccharide export system protein LptA
VLQTPTKYIGIIFLISFFSETFSQVKNESSSSDKYIEVSGQQKMIYDKKMGANRLLGGVNCKHGNTNMTCDSAWLYDNNTLEAFGHVYLRQGDSLSISGDHLNYDGAKRIAVLEGNITCREKDMMLSSKQLVYDLNTSVASYSNGGTIQNRGNTLTSKRGSYHSPSKTLSFRYNVKLTNAKYYMLCDTLQYNTVSKIARFEGPSTIYSDSNTIYTEKGWYNTKNEKCLLHKNPLIKMGSQTLKGDSMLYDRNKSYGVIFGNTEIKDSIESTCIKGYKAEHWQNGGLYIVSGKPQCEKYFKKDTLFATADTFYTWTEPKGKEKILRAWHNCTIFKKDLQGKCDSLTFTSSDSLLILHKSPILWSDKNQLTAKNIIVKTGKKGVKQFLLKDNAMLIGKKDSVSFDQIKGKTIEGFLVHDSLRTVYVKGNSQCIFFVEQSKKIVAMNRTDCSEMTLSLDTAGVQSITFIKKPTATIKPIKELKPNETKLKGFLWLWEEKPKRPIVSKNY